MSQKTEALCLAHELITAAINRTRLVVLVNGRPYNGISGKFDDNGRWVINIQSKPAK